MKKILITGKDSYIGTSFENWVSQWPDKYKVTTIDVRDDSWKNHDFSYYDVVFHVAGIAHVSTNHKLKDLYFRVNRDLTYEIAKKAKHDKVDQFIFMSSIIVYGDANMNDKIIDINTTPKPSNFYGDSKIQAEDLINQLRSNDFKIVILRPPMIYGRYSKGNYLKLSKIAKITPIFPKIKSNRSMLHIDNLCEFLRLMIENHENGIFFPQNSEYVNISLLVKKIRYLNGKKTLLTSIFNPIIYIFRNSRLIRKVFGNLKYDMKLSNYDKGHYQIRSFDETVKLSECFIEED